MEKPIPSNINAERAVLGACLLDRGAVVAVADFLEAGHFHLERHAQIWAAVRACYDRRTPPDLVNVADELRRHERLDGIGGPAYLIELSNSVPTAVHIEYYARIVERTAMMRHLIAVGGRIAALGFDESREVEELAAEAQSLLSSAVKMSGEQATQPIAAAVIEVLQTLFEGVPTGIATGVKGIDRLLGGIHPQRLHLFAGMPGSGKSSLLRQIGRHVAEHTGPALLFSMEMGRQEIAEAYAAAATGIEFKRISQKLLRPGEGPIINEAMTELTGLPIYINEHQNLTTEEIRLHALRLQSEVGQLAMIGVDYLQLIAPMRRRGDNPALEVNEAAKQLKKLAREMKVPVVVLSQLTKEARKRGGTPQLTDLSYGGDADADTVAIMVSEDFEEPPEQYQVDAHFVKHRQGAKGVVPLMFHGRRMRFFDVDVFQRPEGF